MQSKARKNFIAIAAVCSVFAACSKDDNNDPDPSTPEANVQVADNAALGKVMTDSAGNTLYFFSLDAADTSACTGGCLAAWPVFYVENLRLEDTSLHADDFGTITRADGAKQTTYKGWPLYYYANDNASGDVNGEAVNNVWYVAKPDYTVMLANAQLVGNNGVEYNSQYQPGQEITQYITDAYGRTLYAFAPDKFNTNTFTASDFSNNAVWPVFEMDETMSVPSILDKADFDTLHVFGRVQLSYKGWPLYYFGNDQQQRGSNKGVSVPQPGVWPVVNGNTTVAPQP
ncbi:hypothetical protein [Chitinophaga japonensis]|uniref:Secreted repeat protein with Y-X4-D motif n=1 Tax=Chitinophaga japonensis TaxID=104662 RepID=A0A562TH04_CHIJA|nr:hypothetical protein [Chitinophaga japonensis]TWI92130.1 secreted repeat protein with Y-X4-D motif [Chitinophaga japonensis]